ncbi:MAG: Do family serine endopeptidase [Planctomycetota bacterium]|jgi:serine protease Do|nr:Do family serine endopeptidase [Planctomycetota bacterium]
MRNNLRFRAAATATGRENFGAPRAIFAAILVALLFALCAPFARAGDSDDVKVAKALSNAYAEVVDRVAPAVVGIVTTKTERRDFDNESMFGNEMLERFFRNLPREFDPRFRFRDPKQDQERRTRGFGSGVIIDPEGHILTNNHVIADADKVADKIEVLIAGGGKGKTYEAELVGRDPNSDLAVIKLKEPPANLTAAQLGDSDAMKPGNVVLAIGSPMSLTQSVSTGIISAKGRALGQIAYEQFIQTDASINPGNSGGPLVNLDGKVIGLNTIILTKSGGFEGIGFAIPINQAKTVINQLVETGSVVRGWLGIAMNPDDPEISLGMGHDGSGVVVTEAAIDGPAAKAGIRKGDLIISFDNMPITDNDHLRYMVAETAPGRSVPVVILRSGERVTLMVDILPQPEDLFTKGRAADPAGPDRSGENREDRETREAASRLGIEVRELDAQARQLYGIEESDVATGVVITKIDPEGPAADKGIEPGVTIMEMNQRPVKDVATFRKILQENLDKDKILVYLKRGAVGRYMMLKLQ